MDAAGTFFPSLTTILLALQDKSVSFHFANFFDLDELDFFEFISVICRHGKKIFSSLCFVQLLQLTLSNLFVT